MVKQQKVDEEVDEEKVIYRGEKIYYEVSVGNKDYESLKKLGTKNIGAEFFCLGASSIYDGDEHGQY